MTKRISGVIHSLANGGAEKNFAALFNDLSAKGYPCTVICLSEAGTQSVALNREIKLIQLQRRSISAAFLRIKELRNAISESEPDCVLSFMDQTNILTLLALGRQNRTPVIVCERNNPARNLILSRKYPLWLQAAMRLLRNCTYQRAHCICAQTDGAAGYFKSRCPGIKAVSIANFIEKPEPLHCPDRENLIISVARLVPEKGLSGLIQAFNELKSHTAQWRLEIYGDGPEKHSLELLIRDLGLKNSVKLFPKTSDIQSVYNKASIFVLNSAYEGYPNALLEAMASGCAVIASDCEFGPAQIIKDNFNGFLVKVGCGSELVNRLKRLTLERELRELLGDNAKTIADSHSRSVFTAQFEKIISETIKC